MMLWLAIVARIVANPLSNVFQKLLARDGASPLWIIGVTHGLLSLVCGPVLWFFPPPETSEFWINILVCAVLAITGNVLIVQAVKLSDLSVLGPLNAYKSVVSLVPGLILLHEVPGLWGLAGIGLIIAGSYFLMDKDAREPGENIFVRFFRERGVQYRLAALVLSATEAVFLKRALLASSPLVAFACWAVLGFGVAVVAVGVTWRERIAITQFSFYSAANFLALAATTGIMQFCTLVALEGIQVGYALALFQTSALLSVLLGYKLFQEQHVVERVFGSLVMIAGAVLIIVGR